MQRAQNLHEASGIVFIDSTASCDSENNSVTFVLTASPAGAVPLAVIITTGQSETDYKQGFQLMKNCTSFGGQPYPQVIMTDDSDAEQNALRSIWPESTLRLCIFHVNQANWRWLWDSKNKIKKEDRPILMKEFKIILKSISEVQANESFEAAKTSSIGSEYPSWQKRLESYWKRRNLWCLAFRSAVHRGHHTNNVSEVTVRLFKDIVLNRCKAYNIVALVDFVCTVMDKYYCRRLRLFAHSRCATPFLLLEKMDRKSAYLQLADIKQTSDVTFEVKSETLNSNNYTVDVEMGVCTCVDGVHGKFCKHQAGVVKYFHKTMLNAPPVSAQSRHAMSVLALGDRAEALEFYQSLTSEPTCSTSEASLIIQVQEQESEVSDVLIPQNLPNSDHDSVDSEDMHETMLADTMKNAQLEDIWIQFKQLHEKFGSSQAGLTKLSARLNKISSAGQWETLLNTVGSSNPVRHHHRGIIRVQPAALARRAPGVTRGSKRKASGRPPTSEHGRKHKRPRNLNYNIKLNQPNAKSHGEGH